MRASQPWTANPPIQPVFTHDAVVLLPGIMGSVLRDAYTDEKLWGLSGRALADAWTTGRVFERLKVTDDERKGLAGRVAATEPLTLPVGGPLFNGIEPYDLLRKAAVEVTLPGAVLDFPYDWRLSVAHNADLLVEAAHTHLRDWRRSCADRPELVGLDPPRLVFVAHSMGGLIVSDALHTDTRLAADTRSVITLGTPFAGSVLAAAMLAGEHKVAALPTQRLRTLAVSAPGVYDLLPIYPCLDTGTDVLRLTPEHVAALGGDLEQARLALARRSNAHDTARALPGHSPAIGIAHPTPTSIALEGGRLTLHLHGHRHGSDGLLRRDLGTGIPLRFDRRGDGTVPRDAAHPGPTRPSAYIPARHSALTRHEMALDHVKSVLTDQEPLGPMASGRDGIGIVLPDQAQVGQPWTLEIHTDRSPSAVQATIGSVEEDRPRELPLRRGETPDGGRLLWARHSVGEPGIYRVTVDIGAGPNTELTELLLVTDSR
ncbi:lipase/acyltransferase domain-containing protein [Actinospica robiniae]|uniref:lipase/acyltransferase domain-containing protein n=1 Tax=Actinospica robiniae TaxID=304901 RepID=UPI000403F09E|nr:hypothetical protein [Actinospica robiniae]